MTSDYEIVFEGMSVCQTYEVMIEFDGVTETPPLPKVVKAAIPYGSDIDLSESILGDVAFENRKFEISLICPEAEKHGEYKRKQTRLWSALDGRRGKFKLSWDPDYTYTGRISMTADEYLGNVAGRWTMEIDCDPWKVKEVQTYRLDAFGGREYWFESGRKPVHPIVECMQVTTFEYEGVQITVPIGTYRLNDVLFHLGMNKLYINSHRIIWAVWDDVGEDGEHEQTWDSAGLLRWDELAKLGYDGTAHSRTWDELRPYTWDEMADSKWRDFDARNEIQDSTVYLAYDWADL